jgi:predicted ABC-type sugar transport system permease subunit
VCVISNDNQKKPKVSTLEKGIIAALIAAVLITGTKAVGCDPEIWGILVGTTICR